MKHERVVSLGFAVALASACGSPDRDDVADAMPPVPCASTAVKCEGQDYMVCENDVFVVQETCANHCSPELGCTACEPFTGTCSGMMSTMCVEDGSGFVDVLCDPVQGMTCNFETGVCAGDCAPQFIGKNYIGCDYWPTITGNAVANDFEFAVVISNAGNQPADITIEGGSLAAAMTLTVDPQSVTSQALPWDIDLKGCEVFLVNGCRPTGSSAFVQRGAYHLRSTQPITVFQFNPLDYLIERDPEDQFSFSNDASLLLPVTAMSPNYHVAAWPTWDDLPGTLTVTATENETMVTINSAATTLAGPGAPLMTPGTPAELMMNAGDVIQLFSDVGDFTGSTVNADKPVQVFGGHFCTNIPSDVPACDHIEESMFPLETLGTRYVVTSPSPASKGQHVRIIATQPGTTLVYNPEQPSLPSTLANAGDFVEIVNTTTPFEVAGNHRLLVAQYMQGQTGGGIGDPAMTLAVPAEQYRTSYQFHAPTNYETNWINVVAPLIATVTLDGEDLPTNFAPIGNSGWGFTRKQLDNTGNGDHIITSDEQFGVQVYGYGQFTSYWYPGGLDLNPIDID